jgi:hypothetical protein
LLVALRWQGRRWWCRCGRPWLWSGDIHSGHNSQHLADPYSFSHLLHGLLFYALLRPFAGRLGPGVRLVLAVAVEALWEVAENSEVVIQRYRRATLALGYAGDSLVNSLGDVACCVLGYLIAARIPARWSVALFVLVELTMLAVYRDCLLLNVLMLVYPVDAIKAWQTAR